MSEINTAQLLTIFVGIFTCTGFWNFALSAWNRKQDKKDKAEEEKKQKVITPEELTEVVTAINNRIDLLEQAELAILHDRLYQSCTYYLKQGSIPIKALENLKKMYAIYRKLGGNGLIQELFEERVMHLPLEYDE